MACLADSDHKYKEDTLYLKAQKQALDLLIVASGCNNGPNNNFMKGVDGQPGVDMTPKNKDSYCGNCQFVGQDCK